MSDGRSYRINIRDGRIANIRVWSVNMNDALFAKEMWIAMIDAYQAGAKIFARDLTDMWFEACEKYVPLRTDTPGDRVRNAPTSAKSS